MEPETQTTTEMQPIEPCHHMRDLVSSLSDDSLKGPARWYTQFHVAGCPRCKQALKALRVLHDRLATLGQEESARLSPDRQKAVKAACDEIDKSAGLHDS